MHSLALSNQFGGHNRDNMHRWEAAGYLNWANALAGELLDSRSSGRVLVKLVTADALAAVAKAECGSGTSSVPSSGHGPPI